MTEHFCVPIHLGGRPIPKWNNNPLNIISCKYQIDYVDQITSDVLQKCYLEDGVLFWKVVKQLAFYGVPFSGTLAKHSIVKNVEQSMYLWAQGETDKNFSPPIPETVLSKAREYGILFDNDAVGIPLDSFRLSNGDFPVRRVMEDYGFLVLDYHELLRKQQQVVVISLNDNDKLIQLDNRILQIPNEIRQMKLKRELFMNCPGVIPKLIAAGITTYEDLPSDLTTLKNLRGVGRTTLKKLFDNLSNIISSGVYHADLDDEYMSEETDQIYVEFFNQKVQIPEFARDELIVDILCEEAGNKSESNWFVQNKIETVSDLPRNLTEHRRKGGLKIEGSILFDALCVRYNQPDLTLGSQVRNMVKYIAGLVHNEELSNKRNWNIMVSKFQFAKNGENPTLQQLADLAGVSKQRVRQVLLKVWETPLAKQIDTCKRLKSDIRSLGDLLHWDEIGPPVFELSEFQRFLLTEALVSVGIYFTPGYEYISTSRDRFDNLVQRLKCDIESEVGDQVVSDYQIEAFVEQFIEKEKLHSSCRSGFIQFVKRDSLISFKGCFIRKKVSKSVLALLVLKEFETGVAIYQDAEKVLERANTLFPGVFESERAFTGALQRESDKALLWGRGHYIHVDKIQVTSGDIQQVADWVIKQFENGVEQLSAYAAFNEFREELSTVGISNEHALYSCFRLFNKGYFFLPKSPRIYPVDQNQNLTNGQLVEQYLRQMGTSKSYSEMYEEFVERRGWKEFTLSYALANHGNIIRVAHWEYGLLEFYKSVSIGELTPLVEFLNANLTEEVPRISIRLVYNNKQATCVRLGINYPELLYSLIQSQFSDHFAFPGFPHVAVRRLSSNTRITNRKEVEDFLLMMGTSVFKEELRQEFIERRGWTSSALDNILSTSAKILPVERGTNAEYVHREVIQWSDEKQRELEEWLALIVKDLRSRTLSFGNVARDLLNDGNIPALPTGFYWTEELLKSLMEDIPFVQLIGTRKSLFAPLPNVAGIKGDVDFLAYLLRAEFDGATKLTLFQQRLAVLDYSYRGDIPKQFQVDSDDLPYYFIGDEIILKDL